ncbi:MAG: autotransporter assembly complex family protein [Cellvibrionaceae bacterium]
MQLIARLRSTSCLTVLSIGVLCSLAARAEIDLEVRGVPDPAQENIRMHLSKWDELPGDNPDVLRNAMHPAVTEALRALGYYHAEVDYALRGDQLTLNIEPGPRLQWGEVDVTVLSKGEPVDDEFWQLIANHPFTDEQVFSHRVYEDYKNSLLTFASRQGYLDAQLVRNRLRINIQEQRAGVVLHVEVGERYKITDVTFSDSRLAPELVEQIAQVPEGEWYSANIVGSVYNRLLNTGYFAGVDINVERVPPNQAHLHINLQDLPKHRVSTGVGFDTDTGPWIKLRWERPVINDRGHGFTTELQLSRIAPELEAQYRIPWGHPQNEYVSWDTGWRMQDTEDVETTIFTTGLSYHRVIGERWRYSFHADFENETSQQGDQPEVSATYVIPSVRFSRRDFRGDATDPNRGYRYWLHVGTSNDSLGSDTDFHRFNGGLNTIFTAWEKHSLVARVEFGVIATDDFRAVPLSQRFFTGGDQSVRGYEFQSIAPRDADNDLTGGERLTVGSVEYRYQFLPTWKAALFVDQGRAYLEDDTVRFDDSGQPNRDSGREYRTGAGVGVRWKSPVGLIAFDIAAPINDDYESGVRVHLYLGTPL